MRLGNGAPQREAEPAVIAKVFSFGPHRMEPHEDLFALGFAHEEAVRARVQFPVDLAQLVAGLVGAVLRELQAGAALRFAVTCPATRASCSAMPASPARHASAARRDWWWIFDPRCSLRARAALSIGGGLVAITLLLSWLTGVLYRRSLEAHLAGTFETLAFQIGDKLDFEGTILILESMKMEIPVLAPKAGTLREIKVAEGEAVAEGQVVALLDT